jgi:2-polyprenyl-6-methoxyphenol hydroxylase-like FAD-dependent oxidoreductase
MKSAKTVLISGASIAGPALAFWLKRHGFAPTLVERAPKPRPGGQAIDIRGKALDVMQRMGLRDAAYAHRTRMNGMSVQDADGNELWRTEERTFSGGRFDSDDIEVLRDDLSSILFSAIPDVEVLFDDGVAALKEDAESVSVRFKHAAERRFDLVVGADGLHSKVRHLTFGDESPFLKELGIGLAVFSLPNYLKLQNWQIAFRDEAKGFGYLIYSTRDNAELRVNIGFAAGVADERRGDVEAQKRLVAEKSAGWGWEVPGFIERMWASTDFYFGAMAQVIMDEWSRGRVTLVGDAGYCPSPFSGQGTSLALVGAYVLAEELARSPDNHSAAFARYDQRMRPYVLLNQALATRDRSEPDSESDARLNEAKNFIEL